MAAKKVAESKKFPTGNQILLLQWAKIPTTADGIIWRTCHKQNKAFESYLIFPYINAGHANEISVEVKYDMIDCSASYNKCKFHVPVYAWRTSHKIVGTIHPPVKSNYTLVGSLANYTALQYPWTRFTNIPFKISMEGQSGIYLAFEGKGSCVHIASLKIYYYTCEGKKVALIRYPAILAPNSTTNIKVVDGFCVENAVQDKTQGDISMRCFSNGTATVTGRCFCNAGFHWSKHCTACCRKFLVSFLRV